MTFKKGDVVRLKAHLDAARRRTTFILQADQVGKLVWASNATEATPSPGTWLADSFELVPVVPQEGQRWRRKPLSQLRVKVLNVCGDWVVYSMAGDEAKTRGPFSARRIRDFQESFELDRE